MPTYEDYERDYWAPDRDQVLASMVPQSVPDNWAAMFPGTGGWGQPGQPVYGNTGVGGGGYPMAYQGGGNNVDWGAIERSWTGGGGKTLGDWQQFVQQNPQIQPYVTGSKGDKLQLPDGTVIDAVYASGLGGQGAQWIREGGGGGGGFGGGGSFGGRAPNPTPFNFAPFQRPGEFSYEEWKQPTDVSDANDPGYSARLREGQKALERSAAARGTLLTGGTMKELGQFAQDYAANEYQNVVNRSLQDYMTNRGNAFQNYQTNYENALNAYKTNFETQFKPWEANYNQAYNSWWGNTQAANMGFQNQLAKEQQRFGQLFNTAQLGLQATGQQANAYGNYGNALSNMYGNYGNNMGELMTGQGNANASGTVGAGNAYGNMFGNMANLGQMWGMYGLMNQQPKVNAPTLQQWHG